jgi:hypothetical protein
MIAKTESGRFSDLTRSEDVALVRAVKFSTDCPNPCPSPPLDDFELAPPHP